MIVPKEDWPIDGFCVDEMIHVPSCAIWVDYVNKYNQCFKTAGGDGKLTRQFVGLECGSLRYEQAKTESPFMGADVN